MNQQGVADLAGGRVVNVDAFDFDLDEFAIHAVDRPIGVEELDRDVELAEDHEEVACFWVFLR
jgi:hypothetical protein